MRTNELLDALHKSDIRLWVEGDRIRYRAPEGALTPELRSQISTHRPELLRLLSPPQRTRPVITQRDRDEPLPLSYVQERLWFLDRMEPGAATYNITVAYRLEGHLDVMAWQKTLDLLIARHETLRTVFRVRDGKPVAELQPPTQVTMHVTDFSALPPDETNRHYAQRSAAAAAISFDLEHGPLFYTELVKLDTDIHVALFTFHHIVSDGWSVQIVRRELAEFYAAFVEGQHPYVEDLPIQYGDYAAWQRDQYGDDQPNKDIAYWLDQLDTVPPLLDLPTDYPRPAVQTYRGAHLDLVLDGDLPSALRTLATEQSASLYMVLLAAFQLLMHRWSGQDELVVGTPVAGRSRAEVEGLIGFFINNLVIRSTCTGEEPFPAFLDQTRETVLAAFEHQELPFERLLEELRLNRDLSHAPVFQVFFNMLSRLPGTPTPLPGLTLTPLPVTEVGSKFDLTLYVTELSNRILLRLVYNPDLFSVTRMEILLQQYRTLLEQIAAHAATSISALDLVAPDHDHHLPDPSASLDDSWEGAVTAALTRQAKDAPDRVALVGAQGAWSYNQLEESANRTGHMLQERGIGADDVVAIYAVRSAALPPAVLGILKAGAAFTILDAAYPPARLAQFVEIARPRALLQLSEAGSLPEPLEAALDAADCTVRISLPDGQVAHWQEPPWLDIPVTPPVVSIRPDSLAYIAFTSGSTGAPKAVMGRHGSLTHFLPWQTESLGLTPEDRFSMLSGLAHDPLHRDLFTPLWAGARLCIPPQDSMLVTGGLAQWMADVGITYAHLTPAMVQVMSEGAHHQAPTLRYTFSVGDKLTRQDVARLRTVAPQVTVINAYGSTETQRAVSYDLIPPGADDGWTKPVYPLGRGMPNVQLLVLNRAGRRAGIGELGEIYLRSPHIALGYLGDPALTARRFLTNPFGHGPEDRIYRTGDLGRYLPDGRVEFAGRADRQLKIRGFRIEPGEIESRLRDIPGVREAVVVAQQPGGREPYLVAFLVRPWTDDDGEERVRARLKDQLPDYMMPAAVVLLDQLPLTPNGKVNYAHLEGMDLPRRQEELARAETPQDSLEADLAHLWAELLGVPTVGRTENFFALGGHSLLTIRLFAQLEERFGRKLPLSAIFKAPTVAGMADLLRRQEALDAGILVEIQPGRDDQVPLFCVHGFGGGVVGYGEMARLLGPDQPVYGLQSRGMDGREEPQDDIRAMATDYIQAMRAKQPVGPYAVCGYCYGGVVAYDVARQLRAAGEDVAFLGVLEGFAPLSRETGRPAWYTPRALLNFVTNFPYWLDDFRKLGRAGMLTRMRRGVRVLTKRMAWRLGWQSAAAVEDILDETEQVPEAHRRVMEAQMRARMRYGPPAADVRITLYRTRARPLLRGHDPYLGWHLLARRGVELRTVAGVHHDILEQPNVASLAEQMRTDLAL